MIFLLFTSLGTARADIVTKLNELEALINQLPMDQDAKDQFSDYIEMIRDDLDFPHFSTTGRLLDALLIQIANMMLEEELMGSGAKPMQPEEDPMDAIVTKVDEIKAEELFFKADKSDLVLLPSETFYMGTMSCSIQIYARVLGPIMFDPGGVLYLRFAETAELMAVPGEDFGNAYIWEWDQGNDNDFYSQGDRAYFRLTEYETANVKVTLQSEYSQGCEAVLRVIMQGGFPMFDDD
jgi:hypothetical protein